MDEEQIRQVPVDAGKVIDHLLNQLGQKSLDLATAVAIIGEKETIIGQQALELAELKKEE